MNMRIHEITPFLHASLYHYPRFESFEDIQLTGIHEWGILSKDTVKQIMLVREQQLSPGKGAHGTCSLCYTNSEGDLRSPDEFGQRAESLQLLTSKATKSPEKFGQRAESLQLLTSKATKSPEKFGQRGDVVAETFVSASLPSSSEDIRYADNLVDHLGDRISLDTFTLDANNGVVREVSSMFSSRKYVSTIFSPRKSDSLFWSMYIAKHGVNEFFEIGSKYMNKEIEEKTKIMEFMKTNRPLLKSMKITSDKGQEIMGDLMTNKKTELTVVSAFALYYQARIWVVSKDSHTYFEFLPSNSDDNTPVFVIYRSNSSVDRRSPEKLGRVSYTVDTHVIEKTLIRIRDDMFRLESPTSHMKGISNYKIADLEKIIKVLGITCPQEITKWKKTDIYNSIRIHCMTAWLDR